MSIRKLHSISYIVFETERLYLALLKPGAASFVADYYSRNREFHKKWAQTQDDAYYTPRMQRKYLQMEYKDYVNSRLVPLFLFEKQAVNSSDLKVVGRISLFNIVYGGMRSGLIGYALDENACGKGYMTEALRFLIKLAFESIHLLRLEADILPYNVRSLEVIKRLGFVEEGVHRSFMEINTKRQDHVCFSLLYEDYKEQKSKKKT